MVIEKFYKKLFGKQNPSSVSLDNDAWATKGRLSAEEDELLNSPFSEEEVRKVIFDMKENSAPGPDGFGVSFYKSCWEIIKNDFMELINDFHKGDLDLTRLNYGVITLVPKVKEANNVKQFRPICLLNVSFKIFTKLLMGRLTMVADKLIGQAQTAFIKGRYIHDGAVLLHEIMHELRVSKKQGVVFKIDFEKAYDSVNWSFVEEVLTKKGFGEKSRHWIMSTIRGGKVCVNINGENGNYFKTHRGLRQGDPLSPLLFNLAADALDHILTKARTKGRIRGVALNLVEGGITHLQYADDTVILMDNDSQTLSNMKFLLYCFEWLTGLRINYLIVKLLPLE